MPVANATFHWTPAYSVNVAELDEQHKLLFRTINELDGALREGKGNSTLDPVLQKLVDYALLHFATEEALMERHNFPFDAPRAAPEVSRGSSSFSRRPSGAESRSTSFPSVFSA